MQQLSTKKLFIIFYFVFYIVFTTFIAAQDISPNNSNMPKGFSIYTLENNLNCNVFEDFSSALVRIEFTVDAGFSKQTAQTAGFFPLYSKLFTEAGKKQYFKMHKDKSNKNWLLKKLSVSCNADSARYIITVTPQQVETVLEQLACCAFYPIFEDTSIKIQFSTMKKDVSDYAFSTVGFINSSIDARIFSEAPWKVDSEIYPAIFINTPLAKVRSILMDIAKTYYQPGNCRIYISGGITKKRALKLLEQHIGIYQQNNFSVSTNFTEVNNKVSKTEKDDTTKDSIHKFVLADTGISKDMTQIVIQYKDFSLTESDLIAALLNNKKSSFKIQLLNNASLGIQGNDYINAAAVHSKNSSRVIIQSILGNTKDSYPVKQAEDFLSILQSQKFNDTEDKTSIFANELKTQVAQYDALYTNSASFMNILSQYTSLSKNNNPVQDLLNRSETIQSLKSDAISNNFSKAKPWVFVLVNKDVYNNYHTAFKKAGYKLVTTKNGSWYTQQLYKNMKNTVVAKQDDKKITSKENQTEQFIQDNKNSFTSFTLSNGIPVIVKNNSISETTVIGLSINGGKISETTQGLEEILINSLAQKIHHELLAAGVKGKPKVLAQTDTGSAFISVECLSSKVKTCIECISQALIFSDLSPAGADGLVYDTKYHYRLKNESAEYQLYCAAVNELYRGSSYPDIFSLNDNVLSDITYYKIMKEYPNLLDAGRYTIIITGNTQKTSVKDIKTALEKNFGILSVQKAFSYPKYPLPNFLKGKTISTTLTHIFTTDIPASEAGPMPEKLIPTTDFSDPVQYWIKAPEPTAKNAILFTPLMYKFTEILQNLVSAQKNMRNSIVKLQPSSSEIQAAVITITKVHHRKTANELFIQAATELKKELSESKETDTISNLWIEKKLNKTQTNRGTALLIYKGITNNKNPEHYLDEYEAVTKSSIEDFIDADKFIPESIPFAVYSKDTKK